MPPLAESPPHTPTEPVTEILHGTIISDPFRWLEDQDSAPTRKWITEQTRYARSYLDGIPNRSLVEERIREFLDIETYDSLQKVGTRYFFRKRLREQEQPCIYLREGANGDDQLLVDPALRETGCHTAVKPVSVSRSGRFLLYEIKQGGERCGTVEILDIETRRPLADMLPQGLLHGFAFSPDEKSFYYAHETLAAQTVSHASVYHHVIGTQITEDRELLCIKEKNNVRLSLISDATRLGILVYRFHAQTLVDFYVKAFTHDANAEVVVADAKCSFFPFFVLGRILALTDLDAPNRRIVEVRPTDGQLNWLDIIPEAQSCINQCVVMGERIFVRYNQQTKTKVYVFDLSGHIRGEIPIRDDETARIVPGQPYSDELFLEHESFTEPIGIFGYSVATGKHTLWARRNIRFDAANYDHIQVQFTARD